jgi:2-polyprenyl-6-methoxyphenol hydroxylase-like FAD-dependent oxidoreductase
MTNGTYDIITVGGGLGGATLAKVMAEQGAKVLVLEQETHFKDRVRGEVLVPWGVVELQKLGVYEMVKTCAHEMRWFDTYLGADLLEHRDLVATTPQQVSALNWYHPEMEEVLLQAAADAGAEVRRGAHVRDVQPGRSPTVVVEQDGRSAQEQARLVVCADGKGSLARKWAGFTTHQDTYGLFIAGVLCEAMPGIQAEINYWVVTPSLGQAVFIAPQSNRRTRAYLMYQRDTNRRLQGTADLPRFVSESVRAGAVAEWYSEMKPLGPLATFDGANVWVEHPYQEGVVLIGDAAAATDPSYGQGQALTVRDVRVLRDHLLSHQDWNAAGHAYAADHDRYYRALYTTLSWVWALFYETGPEAEARRSWAFPLLAQAKTRIPDMLMNGPEVPPDETVRRRSFGEE